MKNKSMATPRKECVTLEEFKALKQNDKIFLKIGDKYLSSTVVRPAFYNADADEPDLEIETTNGFADQYSVYLPEGETKFSMKTKHLLRFPVNHYVLAEMKQMLRCRNINSVYRSDLMFDNIYDIITKWIEVFNPSLVCDPDKPFKPYLESAVCESDHYHCYLDLVYDERTSEVSNAKGYVLCNDLNGDQWELLTKFGYLDLMNPTLRQLYTIKDMEICWIDTEDQPDGYIPKGGKTNV